MITDFLPATSTCICLLLFACPVRVFQPHSSNASRPERNYSSICTTGCKQTILTNIAQATEGRCMPLPAKSVRAASLMPSNFVCSWAPHAGLRRVYAGHSHESTYGHKTSAGRRHAQSSKAHRTSGRAMRRASPGPCSIFAVSPTSVKRMVVEQPCLSREMRLLLRHSCGWVTTRTCWR